MQSLLVMGAGELAAWAIGQLHKDSDVEVIVADYTDRWSAVVEGIIEVVDIRTWVTSIPL